MLYQKNVVLLIENLEKSNAIATARCIFLEKMLQLMEEKKMYELMTMNEDELNQLKEGILNE